MNKMTWADVVLGAWLIASPLVFGYSASRPMVLAENIGPGLFLLVTSVWVLTIRLASLRVSWAQALAGIWLLAATSGAGRVFRDRHVR